jgi:hypothetical protein
MNTVAVLERVRGMSPRAKARAAGVFEALEGAASASGQVVILGRLVVAGSAAGTAANVLGHERLFWFGFALSVGGVCFHVIWVALFYELFKPVNRSLSLVAAFVGLVVCATQALAAFFYLAPLLVLQGGSSMSALTTEQLQGLAAVFLRLNSYAFDLDLAFFGLWCCLTGYLIFKSSFLPRILGILLAIDGVGWMMFVVPPFADRLFPFVAGASAVAEIPLQLWLIIMGVNSQRWKEQASTAEMRA